MAPLPGPHRPGSAPLSRRQALQLMDSAYLAATTALLWVALYYLPVGGPLFRLALPLPLALLLLRHGGRIALEGLLVSVLLLVALMGPIRGPLMLFPYGILAIWLGWGWRRRWSWWLTWSVGTLIGSLGFLVRLAVLSLLLGENLWVVLTTSASGLLEKLLALIQISVSLDLVQVQLAALLLVLLQNLITVFVLHALAHAIFARIQEPIPEPPEGLLALIGLEGS